jgi:hypothetical protein
MPSTIKYLTLFLITAALSGAAGYGIGIEAGYRQHEQRQKVYGMEQLRALLKENEEQHILELVKASADITTKDEGGLFSTKWVYYMNCKILNSASVATVKDVKLRVDFLSKTGAVINSQEINVYEFIRPNREYTHKQKVTWPKEADKFTVTIEHAGYDQR